MRSLGESDSQSQEVDGGGWGLREGRGRQCSTGTEFPFGKMRKFQRWTVTGARQCECALCH